MKQIQSVKNFGAIIFGKKNEIEAELNDSIDGFCNK